MIRIIEIGEFAWQGKTEPIFCQGDDGFEYVVKGRHAGYRALIAEWVANRLGQMIGLPIPEIAQMQVEPSVFDYGADKGKLSKLGRGIVFGSRKVLNVDELRATDIKRIGIELRAKVLAFDWWIANSDRIFVQGRGNPNLLWAEDDARLVVIDHNLAFLPAEMGDFWCNHAFRDAKSLWSTSFQKSLGDEFRDALSHLQVIWNEIPEEWTEFETEFSLATLESILWKFDTDAAIFWNPL
jgi:hypothetical protein